MFCAKCGKEIEDNASFCPECGLKVKKKSDAPKVQIPKQILFSVIGLVVVIIVAVIIVKSGVVNSHSEKSTVNKALKSVTEEMDALSVKISCIHVASGTTNGINAESFSEDSAIVNFKNGGVHCSEGKTYFSLTPVPFDGTSHQEKALFELYCTANDEVIRKIDNEEFGHVTDVEPLKMEDCLWFFESIKEGIKNAEITEVNETTLKVVGRLDNASEICDTYVKFIDLAGDGPEYQVTDKISYELLIDKEEKQVQSICFDLSDIAAYVWYGESFSQTGIKDISGHMTIEYLQFNDADDFIIPVFEGSEEVAAEETTAEEVTAEEVAQTNEIVDSEPSDYVLVGSDFRYISKLELSGFTKEQCRLARNEIYARHGRKFDDEELSNYFSQFDWYVPTIEPEDFDDTLLLNVYEIANRDLIVEYENESGNFSTDVAESTFRNTYINFLREYTSSYYGKAHFCLGYINADDIPELFVTEGNSHSNGVDVYTYYDNKLVYVGRFGSYGLMKYSLKKNYIGSVDSGMGWVYVTYYFFDAGKAEVLYDFSTYEELENDNTSIHYYINRNEVSQDEYIAENTKASDEIRVFDTSVEYDSIYEINEDNIKAVFAEESTTQDISVDVENEVEQIRTWYYDTQNKLDSLQHAAYDTNLDYYFDEGYITKVVAKSGYDGWNVSREYYFHDHKLYFVFLYGDIGEYRLYIKDGVLIRSIIPDGTITDLGGNVSNDVTELLNKVLSEEKVLMENMI